MRLATMTLLLIVPASCVAAQDLDALTTRGKALVDSMCTACHATGRNGESPQAGAPAFRILDSRTDLDGFAERLRQGVTSGHPEMPTYRFSREDAQALVAYLRSIQAP